MKHKKNILISFFKSHYNAKLFLSYLLILLGPLVLVTLYFYNVSSTNAYSQAQFTAEKVLSQTASYLNDKLLSYKNIINVVSYDQNLQNILQMSEEYTRQSNNSWSVNLETNTGNIMYTMNFSKDIGDIHLYSLDGINTFENSSAYLALTEEEKQTWKECSMQIDKDKYLWTAPETFSSSEKLAHTTLYKKIPSVSKLFSFVGIISATLENHVFDDVLSQAASTPNTTVILYNSKYQLIDSYGSDASFFMEDQLQLLHQQVIVQKPLSVYEINYAGQPYLAGYSLIENSDWTLLILTPKRNILSTSNLYINQLFVVVILLFILTIPILYTTSSSMSTGIQKLNEHIADAIQNNYKSIPPYQRTDEVGQLASNFNKMLTQINELMAAQYRSGYELRNLELQMLQSQINPHFLYNSLDMIYWLSFSDEDKRINQIASELGKFYKLSLGHGETIVTIEDELAHIQAYTSVQNIRFDNKIDLIINVPKELYPIPIIKLLLQPLVENSILHGIREKETESGTIVIDGHIENETVILTVSDNGVGMSEEQIQVLFSPPSEKSGYAIWNIDERLKLTYGPSYGLRYISSPDNGTTAEIRFLSTTTPYSLPHE